MLVARQNMVPQTGACPILGIAVLQWFTDGGFDGFSILKI
jgi:hypothetical protein